MFRISVMTITSYVQTIGAADHKLMMRDLKPLSGLGRAEHADFWRAWQAFSPTRREEIAHAMVELAEDNVDLDFNEVLFWCLDDDEASVRTHSIEGLWENDSPRLLRRLIPILRSDPAPMVRAAAAMALSRFAYQAELDELEADDAAAVQQALLDALRDPQTPLDVRRRSLESAGYFADLDEVQRQIELAYRSDEQLLRESSLVAMGRTLLPRWLPMIEHELTSVSPALRYDAARAAGEMAENARTLLPKLAQMINDDDGEVVLMAIWALGQIGGEHARRLLQRVRKSQNEAYREAADEALEEISLGVEFGDRDTGRLGSLN
jgi:HEAT repeat protein